MIFQNAFGVPTILSAAPVQFRLFASFFPNNASSCKAQCIAPYWLIAQDGDTRYVVQHAEEYVVFPNPKGG